MEENNEVKINFFKKIKLSIFNPEDYDLLAAQKFNKAISYFLKLMLLFSAVVCIGILYKFVNLYNGAIKFIENDLPNFKIEEGILSVESEEKIVKTEENSGATFIINTNATETELEEIKAYNLGILFSKDSIILKLPEESQIAKYTYQQILDKFSIKTLNKQDLQGYISRYRIHLYLFNFIFC